MSKWSTVLLLGLSAVTTTAHAADAVPEEVATTVAMVERGRQAMVAGDPKAATQAFDEAFAQPVFQYLSDEFQMTTFTLASLAARETGDYLSALELMTMATRYLDADADHWVLRAIMASAVESWPDAGLAIGTLAKRWPKSLRDLDDWIVSRTIDRMGRDSSMRVERIEVIGALFDARYRFEWDLEPTGMWRDLALDALERQDMKRARAILARIDDPGTLIRMRIDKRFDALVQAEPRSFDIAAALIAQGRRLGRVASRNPDRLAPTVDYLYALLAAGQFEEVISVADVAISRNARSTKAQPVFPDAEDRFNWVLDNRSRALRGLGRWEEALQAQEQAARENQDSADLVGQAINLGLAYVVHDRSGDALAAIDRIDWSRGLSAYGRMQLQRVRFLAYLQQGKREEAERVYTYLSQHRADAPDTWQEAMLEWGDLDGAAAHYIARLRDPEQRSAALFAAQHFLPVPLLPREAERRDRWNALLSRTDVTAAIEQVGRRESHPYHDL